MTTLWAAAAANDAAAVERLLRDALVPVDDTNDLGETALHLAAARGNDAAVRVLLQHNASLTAADWESGWTPLHRSVYNDRLSTTLLLLRHARAHFGKAFMHSYLYQVGDLAHQSAIDLLSQRLADVFADQQDALRAEQAYRGDEADAEAEAEQTVPTVCGGAVFTFGKADFQLGYHLPNADVQAVPRLVELPVRSAVVQISAGKYHTIALSAAGECFVWGFGKGGRLGTGTEFDHVEPTRIASLAQIPIQQVAAGENHTLALSRSGQVFSWGANSFGQLGHSLKSCTQQSRTTPKRIDAFRGRVMTHIAVSGCHSAAICGDDHGVYTWGGNKKGQLGRKEGLGTDQAYPTPRCVDALVAHHPVSAIYDEYDAVRPVQVALSDAHTSVVLRCARNEQSHGQVWQFGYGSAYPVRVSFKDKSRAGSALLRDAWVPSWKQAATDIVQVSCAQNHSIALAACGAVYTWGHNGQALSHSHKPRECVAVQLPGAPQKVALAHFGRVASICASQDHCAVVTADGSLITWGFGSQNVLGHGQGNTWQPNPKRVPGVRKALAVATGHQHTAVLIAPYTPVFRAPRASAKGIPSLLSMTQQLIAQYTDLSNCVTLWKYASALATTGLERYAFEFMRLNWDAILEMAGRERIELLFELFLPPIDRVALDAVGNPKHAAVLEPTVPPSPVLAALRDLAMDKRAEKRGKIPTGPHGSKTAPAAVAAVEPDANAIGRPIPSEAPTRVEGEGVASLVPLRVPRKKAAKFVSLDAFLDQKKRVDASSQPSTADAASAAPGLASPWRTVPSSTSALPPSASAAPFGAAQDVDDGFSIGRPKASRKGSVGQCAAPPATPPLPPSVRTPSIGSSTSIPASPGLAALSLPPPAAPGKPLLAQDGSERQLLSTFSLDAFMKKPTSRSGRKKGAVADDAKPSWSAAATATPLARAPAKTLKEIQEEEEARVAAEAAAKARNGSYVRRTSTVNSWGLCEAQGHVSFAELQQLQEKQEFVEQQRQILAQIERERRQQQPPPPPQSGGGRKKSSNASVKKAKDAPKKKPQDEQAEAERKASKASKKKKRAAATSAASGRPDASEVPAGSSSSKAKKKARESRGRAVGAPLVDTRPGNVVSAA
ncbi:hypothetical protein PybrP1_003777 [[Pythium] brassicae (nom. inval.)]|nr:hypothetical protein PybrP1_003777 [[Pythium] brassicae (nom. inval.)]